MSEINLNIMIFIFNFSQIEMGQNSFPCLMIESLILFCSLIKSTFYRSLLDMFYAFLTQYFLAGLRYRVLEKLFGSPRTF